MSAGISGNDATWLQNFYANPTSPKPYFDALGAHPYSGVHAPTQCYAQARDELCGLQQMRNVMVNNGDSGKEMWLTEFGWTTYTNPNNGYYFGVSEANQASYTTSALNLLEQGGPANPYSPPYNTVGPYSFVRTAIVYSTRDWGSTSATDPEAHYGLVRNDWNGTTWSLKPAYTAFQNWATARP